MRQRHCARVAPGEVVILLRSKQPTTAAKFEAILLSSGIKFHAPDESIALVVADARLKYPLNLGDCFVYALAKSLNEPILALDSDFAKTDARVVAI